MLFKKILLFILAIQSMVLIQILTIKKWNLQPAFEKLTTLNFLLQQQPPKLSDQEYKFYSTLSSSIQTKLEKYEDKLFQNNFFTVGKGHIRRAIKNDVENTAKSLLGTPYVWGATGPNKFDCSGFTQKVFYTAGIHIPRNSRAQAKVGKYIPYENLKRGDMVFFETNRKKPGYITHVGIYLSDGKFIHASSGGKRVIISSFTKSRYYRKHFVLGRRVIRGYKTKKVL